MLQRPPQHDYHYAVRKAPALTGDDIVRDSVRTSPGTAAGEELVTLELTSDGRLAFARLTKEVARTGGRDQGWHHIAVVVDDEIVAFPEIDFDVYPGRDPECAGDPVPRRERSRRRRPGRAASGRLAGSRAAGGGPFRGLRAMSVRLGRMLILRR